MPTIHRTVPGFRPSAAALHFANRWPSAPAIAIGFRVPGPVPVTLALTAGDAADGLCGGMALVTLDLWRSGQPPPPDREAPAPGSELFRRIVRRQVDSLDRGRAIWRFYRASAASPAGRARIAVLEAWPAIRAAIDAGRPALVGLIHVAAADPRRLIANHQVLAYGYALEAEARRVSLAVYDPNHPDEDGIQLVLAPAGRRGPMEIEYIIGEAPVIGIVHLRDRPGRPPARGN